MGHPLTFLRCGCMMSVPGAGKSLQFIGYSVSYESGKNILYDGGE